MRAGQSGENRMLTHGGSVAHSVILDANVLGFRHPASLGPPPVTAFENIFISYDSLNLRLF
jgi:hypothetical protein